MFSVTSILSYTHTLLFERISSYYNLVLDFGESISLVQVWYMFYSSVTFL